MLAEDVLLRVRILLQDTAATRWSNDELLLWLTDAQRALARAIPASTATFADNLSLNPAYQQSIPPDGFLLIKVNFVYNALNPSTFYQVRVGDYDTVNAVKPWRESSQKVSYTYIYDPKTPLVFWLFPKVDSGYFASIAYSKIPSTVTSLTQILDVKDIYTDALVNYVMYKAHMKETDFSAGNDIAMKHFELFRTIVADMQKMYLENNINLYSMPQRPEIVGAAA